tara:strand:- start:171 stop:1034 length:864 start_codon:yes stop_codon:yes gene_type:complete
MKTIIESLEKFVLKTEKNKSSHWKHHLKEKNYKDIFKNFGFGNYSNKNIFKSPLHRIFQNIIFGTKVFKTIEFLAYKEMYDSMDRQIDVDAVRHIFTFKMLKNFISPNKIVVIGDGKANFVLGAIKLYDKSQIYSINLAETLINDYLIIKKSDLIKDSDIQVIKSLDDKILEEKKLILIPSNLKNILFNSDIELFVNIVSFQEMNNEEINNYFEIIKNNKSLLYSCNREKKILRGGENLVFKDYPWGNGKVIFFENCGWHQRFYTLKPPLIKKYDGNIMHCLIDYSK